MIQATNLNQSSAADPISQPRPGKGKAHKQGERGFKSNLDDRLAQAGGIEGAQSQLAAMLAAQSQGMPLQKPIQPGATGFQQHEKGQGNSEIGRPGKELAMRMDDADYSPVTAKVSGSVNAASTIAGLKPWDHQWVFEGNPNPANAQDVRPLIGPSDREAAMAELQQVLGRVAGPGAAQISPNLRTAQQAGQEAEMARGDQGIAGQSNGMAAIQTTPAERMHMAQIAGALNGNLAGQLHAMQGQLTDISSANAQANPSLAARKVALVNGQLAGGSGLSGAEFMSTLGTVRPNQLSGREQSMQQNGQGFQDGQSGAFGQQQGGLRVIEGAKSKNGLSDTNDFVMASPAALHSSYQYQPSSFAQQHPVVQLSGVVVPGSMAQDRLAHDAITNMSTGIRNMSAQGGGEMRIRLKPENLGELHLRVVSQGGEIGLHIQASDDNAKKILQDSLSALKDGLAKHNLTLGSVSIVTGQVAQSGAAHAGHHDTQNGQQQSQQQWNQQQSQSQFNLGQNASGNHQQHEARWSDPDGQVIGAGPLKSAAASSLRSGSNAATSRSSDGRLDVLA